MSELEAAWREGYAAGYLHGADDVARADCGGGPNRHAARDENDEWDQSETKPKIPLANE